MFFLASSSVAARYKMIAKNAVAKGTICELNVNKSGRSKAAYLRRFQRNPYIYEK